MRTERRLRWTVGDFRLILIEASGFTRCGGIVGGDVGKCANDTAQAIKEGERRLGRAS